MFCRSPAQRIQGSGSGAASRSPAQTVDVPHPEPADRRQVVQRRMGDSAGQHVADDVVRPAGCPARSKTAEACTSLSGTPCCSCSRWTERRTSTDVRPASLVSLSPKVSSSLCPNESSAQAGSLPTLPPPSFATGRDERAGLAERTRQTQVVGRQLHPRRVHEAAVQSQVRPGHDYFVRRRRAENADDDAATEHRPQLSRRRRQRNIRSPRQAPPPPQFARGLSATRSTPFFDR